MIKFTLLNWYNQLKISFNMKVAKYIVILLLAVCGNNIYSQTNYTYTYDDLNRLTQVVYGNGVTIGYTYDEVGNRTQKVIAGNTNQKPDMTPTNGSLSLASIGAGGSITVTWKNENIGTALASGYSTIIALSTDAVYQAGTDIILATEYTNSNPAGAMPTVSRPLSIPSNQAAGNYKILIATDPSNAIVELSEANNLLVLDLTVVSCTGVSVNMSPTAATCNASNGSATATGAGGTGFTYKWNTGATGATLSNLSAGTYTVTATSSTGCQATQSTTVTNSSPPSVPNFTFQTAGVTTIFTNTSSNASGYIWNFGDNTTSTDISPTKNYAAAGAYNVCLTATNATCGNTVYCLPLSISGNGCDMVSGFSASNVTQSSMTVTWGSVAVATSYTFRYRQANEVNTPSAWVEVAGLTVPNYSMSGLALGTAYEFQVKTYCSGGATDWSPSFYWATVSPYTGTSTYPYQSFYKQYTDNFTNLTQLTDGSFIGTKMNARDFTYSKINGAGDVVWSKKFTTNNFIVGYGYGIRGLEHTSDGGFIALISGSAIDGGWELIKFDTNGSIVWSKYSNDYLPGGDYEKYSGNALKIASDGSIFVGGSTFNYISQGYQYLYRNFVQKFDNNGNLLLNKRYATPYTDNDQLTDILVFNDNSFAFCYNYSNGGTNAIGVVSCNSSGTIVWKSSYFEPNPAIQNQYLPKYSGKMCTTNQNDIFISFWMNYNNCPAIYGSTRVGVFKIDKNTGNVLSGGSAQNGSNGSHFIYSVGNGQITYGKWNGIISLNNDMSVFWSKWYYEDINLKFQQSCFIPTSDGGYLMSGTMGSNNVLIRTLSQGQTVSCVEKTEDFYSCGFNIQKSTESPMSEAGGINNSFSTPNLSSISNLSSTQTNVCTPCYVTAGIIASKTNPCQNEAVTFSAYGSGLYYTWTIDGVVVSNQRNFVYSFAQAGSHEVHLLVYNNESCFAESSYIYNTNLNRINVQAAPSYTVATVNETCDKDNGAATVTLTSQAVGATVAWSNGKTGISQNGLNAGTYQVLVTGSNGCSATSQSFTINNAGGNISINEVITPITCNGANNASISVSTLNSTAPNTYSWSNGASSNPLSNLAAGTYTVTATDGLGCTQSKSFVITEPSKLRVQMNVTDITNCGSTNGTITASNLGGTPPYSYQWSNGQTTQTAIGLVQNNYSLTVTDSKGCTARNIGTVGMQGRSGEIFYSNSTLSGISNVVLHRGQFALMVGNNPADHFVGYPDTGVQFYKLDLINETGTLFNLETSSAAASIVHGNITTTPDGKLSMVYQAPTGSGYGFRGMHRIYDTGNSLTLDEQVFSNANWGAWMRHIEETNRTRVVSFANDGYYVLHHKKENGGAWQTVSLGGGGNYLGSIQLAKKSDNSLWLSGRYGTGAIGTLRYYTSLDGTSYGYSEFLATAVSPSSNCDIKFTNTEQLSFLVNQNDTLKLLTNTSGSSWSIENIVYQPNIDHRATLYYRANGNTVLAYQATDKLVVMEKASGVWSVKYAHNNLIQSDQIGGSRAPSLLLKGSDLWVVYADGQNVYKYDLDLPCDYVQLYAKVLLQGSYNSSTGLMNDNLRSSNLIPTNEPYTGLGFTNIGGGSEAMLAGVSSNANANDAIVDWVFLELRDGKAATTKVATRCALVQRDGDIVDIDGISPITFKNVTSNTNYYVVIKHRNHFGVMTALPTILTRDKNLTKIDFINPSVATWGTNAQKNVSGKMCLWAGDVNQDHLIKYNGSNNDKNVILSVVGLTTPNNIINAYHKADINLDGLVKYNGASNDKNVILSNVGLLTPNNILTEQIPN